MSIKNKPILNCNNPLILTNSTSIHQLEKTKFLILKIDRLLSRDGHNIIQNGLFINLRAGSGFWVT